MRTAILSCFLAASAAAWRLPALRGSATGVEPRYATRASLARMATAAELAGGSLTPASTWRLAIRLTPPGAEEAADAAATELTVTLRFATEGGYEPPQGLMLVESSLPEGAVQLGEQADRWTLSEDPNDRKDGLWIWGLFEVRTHYLT